MLQWLRNRRLASAVHMNDGLEVVRLLNSGADPNARDRFANPVLCVAVSKNLYDVAQTLLAHGADPNGKAGEPQFRGFTPMHFAACAETPELVTLLATTKAQINAREDRAGTTPLGFAKNSHVAAIIRGLGGTL